MPVVASDAPTITAIANAAARYRRRLATATTTSVVQMIIPKVAKPTSMPRSMVTSVSWLSAHPSACLPHRSKSSMGERSWVTISPNTATTARQASAPGDQSDHPFGLVMEARRGLDAPRAVIVSIAPRYHLGGMLTPTHHLACVR